jgi:hypothetical protein
MSGQCIATSGKSQVRAAKPGGQIGKMPVAAAAKMAILGPVDSGKNARSYLSWHRTLIAVGAVGGLRLGETKVKQERVF